MSIGLINEKILSTLVLLFLAGLVFLNPTGVKADELKIPSSFQIEGLYFKSPFSVYQPYSYTSYIPANLRFGAFSPIVVEEEAQAPVSTVILPNISHLAALPTPVEMAAELPQNNLVTMVVPVVESSPLKTALPSPSLSPEPSSSPVLNIVSPIPTPELTMIPTPTPSPSAPSLPSATPVSSPSVKGNPATGGLDAEKIFDLVNKHRASINLPALEKDDRACALAQSRAPEIAEEIANGHMHSGLRARNLTYWNSENIISMNSEEKAFNWWIHDYIHKVQIEGDYKYSCVACFGNSCVEEFTNFVEKTDS